MRSGVLVSAAGAALIVVGVVAAIGTLGTTSAPPANGNPSASPTPRPTHAARPSDMPCQATLQAEVDAVESGATLDLRGCVYAAGATIDKPLTIVGATVTVPAAGIGITVEADDVTLDGLTLIGAQARTYVFEEIGVYAQAPPERPIRRLTIRDSEIAFLGGLGTYLRNVADLRLEGNDLHDIVYAGLMVLSATGGTIEDNVVRRIGVQGADANGGNAYGIVLTTGGEGEPPSSGFVVRRNTVEDVPTWHALDTHGGNDIVFTENTVRRSMRGIFITVDGAGNEPTDIAIVDNQLLSPAPVATNLAAITLYRARVVAIIENTVTGWGAGNFLNDFEGASTRVVVAGNTVEP